MDDIGRLFWFQIVVLSVDKILSNAERIYLLYLRYPDIWTYRQIISLLPILLACEINIKFNSTFFFFDENIQFICLKWMFKTFVCILKPMIIESYTERNESLNITQLRNPIVCSRLFLKQTQAYIYFRLVASGIDKIHNCPKCLKEKHSKPYAYVRNPVWIETAVWLFFFVYMTYRDT